ncbi:hypothetical protein [Gloeobacter violaceus]|nr:hypothetical protein [Gloeobacter violaceus]
MRLAVRDTDLPYHYFPVDCPYTSAEVLSLEFFPEGPRKTGGS